MNGSETLKVLSAAISISFSIISLTYSGSQESDSQPLELCPVCHDKLKHVFEFDAEKRWTALQQFCERNQLEDDARLFRARHTTWLAFGPKEDKKQ